MPITMFWEAAGYHKRYDGQISGRDIANSVSEQVRDPRFQEVRYAINEYAPGTVISVTADEVTELEHIEKLHGYRERNILITYVTEDPRLIEFLSSVYLQSLMVIYPTLDAARRGIRRILAENEPLNSGSKLNPVAVLRGGTVRRSEEFSNLSVGSH